VGGREDGVRGGEGREGGSEVGAHYLRSSEERVYGNMLMRSSGMYTDTMRRSASRDSWLVGRTDGHGGTRGARKEGEELDMIRGL